MSWTESLYTVSAFVYFFILIAKYTDEANEKFIQISSDIFSFLLVLVGAKVLNMNTKVLRMIEGLKSSFSNEASDNKRDLQNTVSANTTNLQNTVSENNRELQTQASENKRELQTQASENKREMQIQASENKRELQEKQDEMMSVLQGLVTTLARTRTSHTRVERDDSEEHSRVIETRIKELNLDVFDRSCLKELYDIMFYAYLYNKKDLVCHLMDVKWARYCNSETAPDLKYYVSNFAARFGEGWYQEAYM